MSVTLPRAIRVWSQHSRDVSSLNFIVAPMLTVDKKSDVPAVVLDSNLTLGPPSTSSSAHEQTLQ
jgi:hypothetical protein